MSQKWVYFFADGRERRGPFPLDQLRSFALRPETMVWRDGLEKWQRLRDVPELWAIFAERFVAHDVSPVQPISPASGNGAPQVPQTGFFDDTGPALDYAAPDYKPASGLAIASLITGILGLLSWCLPLFIIAGVPLSIAATVMGAIGRKQFRRNQAGGGGLAMAGLVMGVINLAIVAVILGILAWAIFESSRTAPAAAPATVPTSLPVQ